MPTARPASGVQLAPNHVPPEWPDGEQQQQVHLDAVEGWQVHADPAGHPFCPCWHRGLADRE